MALRSARPCTYAPFLGAPRLIYKISFPIKELNPRRLWMNSAASGATARHLAEHAPRTWQRILSGRRLNLIEPSPLDIEIEDIALGLARNTRWNGQTRGSHGWSIAQHSDLVVEITQKLYPR